MRETEIKFPVEDLKIFQKKLNKLGAEKKASFFEDNIVFDDEKHTLASKKQLLRLRKSDSITLTFKTQLEKSTYKVMDEHEIVVSDFCEARIILESLGYRGVFRYQKKRQIYALGETLIMLDETPIGCYIEIEGEKNAIEQTASLLKLDTKNSTSKTYMELYIEHCNVKGISPHHMTF